MSGQWLALALIAYVAGFALFRPTVLVVVDEDRYVSQAVAFASGSKTIAGAEILMPSTPQRLISNYPPGTSLLQAPLVWAFGWGGAAVLSVIALVCAALVVARWLAEEGKPPGFALLIPGFVGASLFGRIAMSDLPSTAMVAVACWALWRAERGSARVAFVAGATAGATLLFREPPVLLLAPLLMGGVLRRRVHLAGVLLGLAVGIGARLFAAALLFGSAWYVRDSGIAFSLASTRHTLPVYALILFVFIPGGALLPLLYRGPRRAELTIGLAAYVALFLFYDYDVIGDQGPLKGILLASRFMAPALPLLAFMAADVIPRLVRGHPWRYRAAAPLARVAGVGTILLSFAVHPLAHLQERQHAALARAMIRSTSPDTPVVTNTKATLKYLSPAYGPRKLIARQELAPDSVPQLLRRHGALSVVLLDRTDSEMFRQDAAANVRFVSAVEHRCVLTTTHRERVTWAQLRVMQIARCRE